MFCPTKMLHCLHLSAGLIDLFIYFTIWPSVLLQHFDLLFDTDILEEHIAPIIMVQVPRSLEKACSAETLRHAHFQDSKFITIAKTKNRNGTTIIIREYLCIAFLLLCSFLYFLSLFFSSFN
jgi:hypothetical protein